MNTLFILNDPPYGTERSYNGIRLAAAVAMREGEAVRVFLMPDAVGCAVAGQVLPEGYYHLDRLLASAIRRGAEVGLCGTCIWRAGGRRGEARRGSASFLARGVDRLDALGGQGRLVLGTPHRPTIMLGASSARG